MHDTAPRIAVVADRRPLERDLLRFLLEEEGFAVRAEAGTMADLLLALQRDSPATIVVQERLAEGHDEAVIRQIRLLAPQATIVVIVPDDAEGPPTMLRSLADTVVVDGIGLAGLGLAATGPHRASEGAPIVPLPLASAHPTRRARRDGHRWTARLQGAVAASIVALGVILVRAATAPPAGPPEALGDAPRDAGPLAPDRPSEGSLPEEDLGDGPLALAGTLAVASTTPIVGAVADGPSEPQEEPPEPTPDVDVEDPPTPAPASPNATPGPPAAVLGRLKPKVQEVLGQLPAADGGRPDHAGSGSGSPPGADHRPPWAGGGNGHGPGGRGGSKGHAGDPPAWGRH